MKTLRLGTKNVRYDAYAVWAVDFVSAVTGKCAPVALRLYAEFLRETGTPSMRSRQVSNSYSKSYTTQHTLAPFLPLSALLLGAPRLGFAQ